MSLCARIADNLRIVFVADADDADGDASLGCSSGDDGISFGSNGGVKALRRRLRRFQRLSADAVPLRFAAWPQSTLLSVATTLLLLHRPRAVPLLAAGRASSDGEVPICPSNSDGAAPDGEAVAASPDHEGGDRFPTPSEKRTSQSSLVPVDVAVSPRRSPSEPLASDIAAHFCAMYAAARSAAAAAALPPPSPRDFCGAIRSYCSLLSARQSATATRCGRLAGGLAAMAAAAAAVASLSASLLLSRGAIDAKTQSTEALLRDLGEHTAAADREEAIAAAAEAELAAGAALIGAESATAGAALSAALPALEAAAAALASLKASDIIEIRSFASPPPPVMAGCLCVLALLRPSAAAAAAREEDAATAGWRAARTMMAEANFLGALTGLDRDAIAAASARRVAATLELHADLVAAPTRMCAVSRAGFGLLQWVIAMLAYADVARSVEHLRRRVKDMTAAQAGAEASLSRSRAALASARGGIASLSDRAEAAAAELAVLRAEAAASERRLIAANCLVAGLGAERLRWERDLAALASSRAALAGDCALAASALAFAGPLRARARADLLAAAAADLSSRGIPSSAAFDAAGALMAETLPSLASAAGASLEGSRGGAGGGVSASAEDLISDGDATAERERWAAAGLPPGGAAALSAALALTAARRGERWPYLVDPQGVAVGWLRNLEGPALRCGVAGDAAAYITALRAAVARGGVF